MKKVVIPLDLSPENFNVLPYLKLFPKETTEFIFLHVWQSSFWNRQQELKLNNKELLDSLKNHSSLEGLNIRTAWLESNQSVGVVLNQYIEKEKADLVLMVVKQKDQLDKMILGTEATKILQNCFIPILVVPRKVAKVQFKKATFFTDASPVSITAFLNILPYLDFFQSEVNIIKVNTPTDFISSREFLSFQNAIHEQISRRLSFDIYCDYEVEKGVLDYALDYNIDLIVLATHGRKGLALMLNGSVTEEVICASFKPVLICRIPN